MITTATNLRGARELIRDSDHWMQHDWMGDDKTYCLLGAYCEASGYATDELYGRIDSEIRFLFDALPATWYPNDREDIAVLIKYNDSRTHQSVLKLLDRAIEKAES